MKIIQVIPTLRLAGAERMCQALCVRLIELGHEVTVVSMFNERTAITDELSTLGIKVIFLDKKYGFDLSMIRKLRRVFKTEKPDAVHVHLAMLKYAYPASFGMKFNIIYTVHNLADKDSGKYDRFVYKLAFRSKKVVPVAISEIIRNSIKDVYKLKDDEISVVYNGIDLSRCIPKDDYSINGIFKILHVGRFSEQKNHLGLLEAFKAFHEKHNDSELLLIGDGEMREEIEKFIQQNELCNSVKLLGLQDDVYGFLHNADLFTLPSLYEGVPISLIEAMGTGVPIVATDVGGVPDMLDKESALLVPASVDEIAGAFEKYYNNQALREEHGKNALERSKAFSVGEMGELYEGIYLRY
ncbi:MAG: glycosyltransferase [Clostridia bacterium]|nr:glycosyltransferase [Clostridia bacterium]